MNLNKINIQYIKNQHSIYYIYYGLTNYNVDNIIVNSIMICLLSSWLRIEGGMEISSLNLISSYKHPSS